MQERFYTGDTLPPMISIAHRAQKVKGYSEKDVGSLRSPHRLYRTSVRRMPDASASPHPLKYSQILSGLEVDKVCGTRIILSISKTTTCNKGEASCNTI